MPDKNQNVSSSSQQRQVALSRWDNEGGAVRLVGSKEGPGGSEVRAEIPPLTNAELVQLHVRTIALENLVVALLANATEEQMELARDMAAYISPRPGFTRHPATLHAAAQMNHLVDRAGHFRSSEI